MGHLDYRTSFVDCICGFLECGKNDVAASVLSSAAKVNPLTSRILPDIRIMLRLSLQFEEQLRNSEDDSDDIHEQAKARAVVLYYCSRMLAVRHVRLESADAGISNSLIPYYYRTNWPC